MDWRTWSAERLEAEIVRHDRLYWETNEPEIDDTLYDQMVEWLRHLRPDAEVLQRLGPAPEGDRTLVRHDRPMLSLDKAYTEDEVLRWLARFEGGAAGTHKLDGVALSLRYDESGALACAATRGNGREGEDVTANAREVGGVPVTVDAGPIEVRGEAWMPLSRFREHYADTFANPRNLAAGALKQKDPARTAAYGLRFTPYDLLGEDHPTEQAKNQRLSALGFAPLDLHSADDASIAQVFESLLEERPTLDFETDGVVFKAMRTDEQERLGETSHHPRYAIAWKYQGETGISRLRDVLWSVSRSGAINPVALIEPVALSGVTVTRVSLHNLGIMETLHGAPLTVGAFSPGRLSPGALVEVTRRGGVIPHLERVLEPTEGGGLRLPEHCPSCGASTERIDDLLLATHSPDCAVAGRRRIEHYVRQIDLEGFGPKLLGQLYDRGLVREPADLYRLRSDDLLGLDRMGEKSVSNLLRRVAARRRLDLDTFLAALGIPGLGRSMSRDLAATLTDLPSVREASAETIAAIDGFGDITAEAVVTWFQEHSELVDALVEQVTVLEAEPPSEVEVPSGPLAGRSVLFTGKLERMPRQEAQEWVVERGGTAPDDYRQGLDFLVLGEADWARFQGGWRSSKLRKAESAKAKGAAVEILAETDFFERFGAA